MERETAIELAGCKHKNMAKPREHQKDLYLRQRAGGEM